MYKYCDVSFVTVFSFATVADIQIHSKILSGSDWLWTKSRVVVNTTFVVSTCDFIIKIVKSLLFSLISTNVSFCLTKLVSVRVWCLVRDNLSCVINNDQ